MNFSPSRISSQTRERVPDMYPWRMVFYSNERASQKNDNKIAPEVAYTHTHWGCVLIKSTLPSGERDTTYFHTDRQEEQRIDRQKKRDSW